MLTYTVNITHTSFLEGKPKLSIIVLRVNPTHLFLMTSMTSEWGNIIYVHYGHVTSIETLFMWCHNYASTRAHAHSFYQ